MPMTCIPYSTMAVLPTPRMAALMPGQSPPALRMPILRDFFLEGMANDLWDEN
jgi:hypothetical protein